MSNYSIERLSRENFKKLIPLMKDCFNMDVDESYLKWKYFDNPAGEVVGFIAFENEKNEIAAYYGAIPQLYSIDGKEFVFYHTGDSMTHSNHRRQGLFLRLSQRCTAELATNKELFTFAFGGKETTSGRLKLGWKHLFDVRHYFIPRLPLSIAYRKNDNIVQIKDYKKIEHLTVASNQESLIHTVKTFPYFQWRLSNPRKDYNTIAYEHEGQLVAYVSYYLEEGKLFVIDFYWKEKSIGKQLIKALKKIMHEHKTMGIVAFVQENSKFSKKLKKLGFISNPFPKGPLTYKSHFILFSNTKEFPTYCMPEKWLIGAFEHDAF